MQNLQMCGMLSFSVVLYSRAGSQAYMHYSTQNTLENRCYVCVFSCLTAGVLSFCSHSACCPGLTPALVFLNTLAGSVGDMLSLAPLCILNNEWGLLCTPCSQHTVIKPHRLRTRISRQLCPRSFKQLMIGTAEMTHRIHNYLSSAIVFISSRSDCKTFYKKLSALPMSFTDLQRTLSPMGSPTEPSSPKTPSLFQLT